MVELFTFAQYAQVFSQELTKKDDSITCAAISSKYISLGTSKGFVHLLDIQLKEAELIGPYTRIYHLTTIGSIVVFCTENKVIAYDSEQANEILNVDVNFPIKVGIANNNLGQLAVVCATNTELVLMQKGWVRVSKRTIKASLVSVNDLKVHAHLVCLATKGKFEFFNLIQEKTIYNLEIPETSKGLIH